MASVRNPKFPLVEYLAAEREHVKGIEEILRTSAREVEARLNAIAGNSISDQLTRVQLEAQRAAIKAYLRQDWDRVAIAVSRGQRAAAIAASRVVTAYENTLLKVILDPADLQAIATSEANRAAAGVQTLLDRRLSSQIPLARTVYKTEALVNLWVDNLVDSALARGLTAAQLAKEVRKFIDPAVPGGASYAAKRLARTEINNAFHASAARRYAESPAVIGVDWINSESHKERDECDDLEAASPYPKDEVPRKPHPQCFCYTVPRLPSREEFLRGMFENASEQAPWWREALQRVFEAERAVGGGIRPLTLRQMGGTSLMGISGTKLQD